ncbi:MAG: ATP-binding cassette domain-containing protein [Verrucomicrobiales bacterium]
MPEISPVLAARNLVKSFGDFTAVNNIDFQIGKGEILGVLGANGAGKTTAINMVLGLLTPTSGTLEIFGMDLAKHRVEILRRTNFCSTYTQLREISRCARICTCLAGFTG